MKIGLMVVEFHLDGCRSLKEKRHRLSGIRDRLGKHTNLAVCESDRQGDCERAQWSFVAVAADSKTVERTIAKVEEHLETSVDARVVEVNRESL